MFCSPRQRASYEANQCLKRAPDFAAIDDATCGRVASELPVASALLIWRVIAQRVSFVIFGNPRQDSTFPGRSFNPAGHTSGVGRAGHYPRLQSGG
jgi:hypothetical protein